MCLSGRNYFFVLIVCVFPSEVLADHVYTHHNISYEEKNEIITERFGFYSKTFPEIQFVHADGGKDWREDLLALLTIIGEDATSMDYKHPPDLAKDLMDVSMVRLSQMLEHDIVSAALFSTGEDTVSEKSYICVVTLNPNVYIGDSRDALHYMLDLNPSLLSKVHPARYLDTYEHLKFTIDHEIFHCLDSYFNGGSPMTRLKLGGQYNLFRRESAADVYALGTHIKNSKELSDYARNIVHVRSLWLFTESPNRCTYDSMLKIYNKDPVRLSKMSTKDLINTSVNIVEDVIGDYDFYVTQRATALQAAIKLGHAPELYGEEWQGIESIETDPSQVAYKIKRYRYYFSQLFTDNELNFTPADLPVRN